MQGVHRTLGWFSCRQVGVTLKIKMLIIYLYPSNLYNISSCVHFDCYLIHEYVYGLHQSCMVRCISLCSKRQPYYKCLKFDISFCSKRHPLLQRYDLPYILALLQETTPLHNLKYDIFVCSKRQPHCKSLKLEIISFWS